MARSPISRLLFCLCLLISSQLMAQDDKNVVVAGPAWEDLLEADGSGMYWDLLHKVFTAQGYQVTHSEMPWTRAESMVQGGRADAIMGEYNVASTKDKYHFGTWPVDHDEITVLSMKSAKHEWHEEQTFAGKPVAWVRGYNLAVRLPVEVKLTEVNDVETGIKMLQSNRIEFLLDYEWDIDAALENLKADPEPFERHKLARIEPLYVGFAPTDKGKALAEAWDKKMAELHASGELDKLFQEYEYDAYPKP
ncbi:substrate-binding periplasmic protein [Pseudomarimonas arenosa]|uniref:Transporter substrate-binding domain-containing protein n=1 Tax=Pseudomarimonas arenosa TaxID=2774145 RepID=A0AAW3ZLX0_9GAMM|nr:transporter substrate-binding domain-containing protein [Pseudomarimonas arenosa]MBD8525644.1 transporter substrate-binding domain-containing protein [Pseudomarimonas arenosa]